MQAVGTVAFVGGLLAWLRKPSGSDSDSGGGLFSTERAAPVVVLSFCATGAAWFLANLDYGVLMHELVLVMGWPPPEHTATVFSMVGPLGQCASALLVLAAAARRGDEGVSLGEDLAKTRMVAGLAAMAPLEIVCVLLALLMGGMAVVWLLLGIITIFYRLSRRELAWNLSWNGIVSPVTTLAVLSILLAMELDSAFFRVAACVIIICCMLMVVVNLGFTVRLAVTARTKRDVSGTGSQSDA
jgi:tellurite resistance protein TehA-like permease